MICPSCSPVASPRWNLLYLHLRRRLLSVADRLDDHLCGLLRSSEVFRSFGVAEVASRFLLF